MSGPTREQVSDALYECGIQRSGYYADSLSDMDCDRLADAVMALLAETQPKVLREGETLPFTDMPGWEDLSFKCFNLDVPPGTLVAVVLAEGTADRG